MFYYDLVKITIPNRRQRGGDPEEVLGWIHSSGFLALTFHEGKIRITHVPTGYRVGEFDTVKHAVAAAIELVPLGDWSTLESARAMDKSIRDVFEKCKGRI
jgi:hypothetical protein